MIPSVKTCFQLMDKYSMLENIRAHSIVVARIACLIAAGLRDSGLAISVEKTTAGALLHDIGKTASFSSGRDHSEIGSQICMESHADEIAEIVAEHVTLKSYNPNGRFSEKEIVYYADKRVNHDTIVSLEQRLAYILDRYGRNQDVIALRIRVNFETCKEVEAKLLGRLNIRPDALADLVKDVYIDERAVG
jgi:uncharacterized protein